MIERILKLVTRLLNRVGSLFNKNKEAETQSDEALSRAGQIPEG